MRLSVSIYACRTKNPQPDTKLSARTKSARTKTDNGQNGRKLLCLFKYPGRHKYDAPDKSPKKRDLKISL
jgi:hypothetical protein